MRNLSKKAKTIIAGAAIAGLASTGVAYAYWTSTGAGSGSATTGTSTAFDVTTAAAVGAALAPAVGSQTVEYTVTNPASASNQLLSAVSVTVANANGTTWVPTGLFAGCSAADYSVGTPTFTAVELAPGATKIGTITITMNETHLNQDSCKNAIVPLYVHAS